ncbi:MAG: glycosyltransferase family 2 protein [Chitinophagaceae bacterium]|nr:glycosyltransferase family 2 protein [Chitinophagaceae bacterium]
MSNEQTSEKFLSIIICSRNRGMELKDCLPLVAKQAALFSDTEVVVVDNGSTDNTKQVVEETAAGSSYQFRYIFEPVPGLCQARNRGRLEAKGKVLAYIDDDVRLGTDWILKIKEHFSQAKTDCLAGKVTVHLDDKVPLRIDESMYWFFGATGFGDKPRMLAYPEHPIGCNMVFTVKAFDAVGGFDTNLKLYGDETELFRRITAKGFEMFYNPDFTVHQSIPANRLTKKELGYKSFIWGKGSATAWMLSGISGFQRIGKIIEFFGRTCYMGIMHRFRDDFGSFYTYWYNRGYLAKLVKGLDK